LETMRN